MLKGVPAPLKMTKNVNMECKQDSQTFYLACHNDSVLAANSSSYIHFKIQLPR